MLSTSDFGPNWQISTRSAFHLSQAKMVGVLCGIVDTPAVQTITNLCVPLLEEITAEIPLNQQKLRHAVPPPHPSSTIRNQRCHSTLTRFHVLAGLPIYKGAVPLFGGNHSPTRFECHVVTCLPLPCHRIDAGVYLRDCWHEYIAVCTYSLDSQKQIPVAPLTEGVTPNVISVQKDRFDIRHD